MNIILALPANIVRQERQIFLTPTSCQGLSKVIGYIIMIREPISHTIFEVVCPACNNFHVVYYYYFFYYSILLVEVFFNNTVYIIRNKRLIVSQNTPILLGMEFLNMSKKMQKTV